MMDQRVSLITLGVADVQESAKFYERLGWTRVASPDGIVAFDLISQTLGLYPRDALAREAGLEPAQREGHSGITLSYNTPSKDQVDSLVRIAEQAGADILSRPASSAWGGYHGFFADPDGHVWEIAFNPFSKLGPDGSFQWNGVA